MLTKAYYIVYGCQATILKANEKLNEEEQARGRGREESVNLYFSLLPFPFLYFKPVVLSLELFIAFPNSLSIWRALFPRIVSSFPLQNTPALQARLFLTPCKLSIFPLPLLMSEANL